MVAIHWDMEELRYNSMEHGVQFVMTTGALRMQMLCADNLDLRELSLLFVSYKL